MKLYIWQDPYQVSYGTSLLIVAAPNLREAKKQAAAGKVFSCGLDFSDAKKFPDYQHRRELKLGEPTRVVDIAHGYAEWHEWAE